MLSKSIIINRHTLNRKKAIGFVNQKMSAGLASLLCAGLVVGACLAPVHTLEVHAVDELPGMFVEDTPEYMEIINAWDVSVTLKEVLAGAGTVGNIGNADAETTPFYKEDADIVSRIISLLKEYPLCQEKHSWPESMIYDWSASEYLLDERMTPEAGRFRGTGSMAFALMVSDFVFGDAPAVQYKDYNDIRPGDILRMYDDSHSAVVLSVEGEEITLVEGGWYIDTWNPNAVHWGRVINRKATEFDYGWTRYADRYETLTAAKRMRNRETYIRQLYDGILDRLPDKNGAEYWEQKIASTESIDQFGDIIFEFLSADESRRIWEAKGQSEYIELLYQVILGRSYDPMGYVYWTDLLESGELTREDVIHGFLESWELEGNYLTCYIK